MVSFSNIFYSVCEQLMMVSSAYLTLTPLVAAEWISRRTRVTFMLLVAAMGVTCGVMYEVLPESKLPLFILMVDVDNFKAINDNYGYSEGDKILVRVAGAIKDACQGPRNRFFISRYGGDEFIIVAEMAYRAEASWLADQIKSNVKKLEASIGSPYQLSVSVGIAQYDFEQPITIQSFIARADSDRYQHKRG